MKKIGMLIGIIISLFGLSIILTPLRTYFIVGWIAGFILLCNGLPLLLVGVRKRTRSLSKCIIGAITTIMGIVLLITDAQHMLTEAIIVYCIAGSIILSGLVECLVAFKMLKNKQNGIQTLITGILSLCIGLGSLIFKDTTVIVIGVIVGYHIIRTGVNIFLFSRNIDRYFYNKSKPDVINLN